MHAPGDAWPIPCACGHPDWMLVPGQSRVSDSPSRDETHKVDVIKFAQNKSLGCQRDDGLMDKDSAKLIWDFIILLCRQNGVCARRLSGASTCTQPWESGVC